MGIPVVDLFATYSFASVHPVVTALAVGVLIAIACWVFWVTRKFPTRMAKLRLGMFAVYLAVTAPLLWAAFKPNPSPMSQVVEAVQQMQSATASDKN